MRTILDLHIHSKYSRACSPRLELGNIDEACRTKGISVIATGDFTYPAWLQSIETQLEEIGSSGLFRLKDSADEKVRFLLSTELSLIYKQGDKVRRIHVVLSAPSLEAVRELNAYLDKRFNIRSDGRPILGMRADELVRLCLQIHPKFLVYPAHVWTPWFSVFGSKSGFDSLEECFLDETAHIYAIETGLSSDPEMNWRCSGLDKLAIISNSDAHSLDNIAREANAMDLAEPTYDEIYEAIRVKEAGKMLFTIEFYPEEGMYHYDGHRSCGIRLHPFETKKLHGICPACKKPLTIGVMYRVEELADRPAGSAPASAVPYRKLVELDKIIAEALGVKSRTSKKVSGEYARLVKELGSELYILLDAALSDIEAVAGARIAEGIRRTRAGELIIEPGYDGVYGVISIFGNDRADLPIQGVMF